MAENISTLVLKVDIHCRGCYKKIKKILSKYFEREIQSHVFDEQQNTVTISGLFDPVSFSSKLRRKAGKAIKSIEIKPVEVPTPAPKAPEAEAAAQAPDREAPKEPALPEPMRVAEARYPPNYGVSRGSCYQGHGEGCNCDQGYGYGYGMPPPQGYGYGYGMPPPAPVGGGHSYDGYNYGNGGRNNEFDAVCEYFSGENPNSCTIM